MNTTTYTPQDLTREARAALAEFKKTLPACMRKGIRLDGWKIRITDQGQVDLLALFTDEAGQHEIGMSI